MINIEAEEFDRWYIIYNDDDTVSNHGLLPSELVLDSGLTNHHLYTTEVEYTAKCVELGLIETEPEE